MSSVVRVLSLHTDFMVGTVELAPTRISSRERPSRLLFRHDTHMLCLFSVTLQLITMVGRVGVEPTHQKGTDLQSAATLRLRRLPI